MGVESRVLPKYFYPVGTAEYGKEHDRIFSKKIKVESDKVPVVESTKPRRGRPKKTKPDPVQE